MTDEENKVEDTAPAAEEVEETLEWEILPWNKNDRYIPTEYEIIDYQRSWKQCYCGRKTRFNDNYCPSCGQKLGVPEFE
jgi:hypothetical protein